MSRLYRENFNNIIVYAYFIFSTRRNLHLYSYVIYFVNILSAYICIPYGRGGHFIIFPSPRAVTIVAVYR